MESCETCGPLPTSTPTDSNPCPLPCTIPVLADNVPKYPVAACDANPANQNLCQPCANVCVPVVVPPSPVVPCIRRKVKYVQPARPKSFAPNRRFVPPEMKMEDNTIYRKSYLPVEIDRVKMILPENHLCVGDGKISQDTVNKMSYMPHKVKPPCPFYPCEHKLIGEGPMQDITTVKHDYVPKPICKTNAIVPDCNLFTSNCPLSDKTVNRLSYMPVCAPRVKPVIPINAIDKPSGKYNHSLTRLV